MPVPFSGTTQLPQDVNGRFFWGLWDGSAFYAPRADNSVGQNLRVALYDDLGGTIMREDDAAVTLGATLRVMPLGALADETSADSVNEGAIGLPRMTLNRILRASQVCNTLNTGTVSVATSSGLFLAANAGAKSRTIYNDDLANSIYLKGASAAAATNFEIPAGGSKEFDYLGDLYAIADAATVVARYAEEVY